MLSDTVCTSMDASNPSRELVMTTRLFDSTSRTQSLNSVLGVAKLVCQISLFFAKTLAMPNF